MMSHTYLHSDAQSSIPSAGLQNYWQQIGTLIAVFARLGTIGFGGPLVHMGLIEDECISRRRWISREAFLEGVAICNMLPGPTSTQLSLYISYLYAGPLAGLIGGISFTAPAFILVLGLSWVYVTYGTVPAMGALLSSFAPVIVAMILHTLYRTAKAMLIDIASWSLSLATCFFVLLPLLSPSINLLVLLLISGVIGMLFRKHFSTSASQEKAPQLSEGKPQVLTQELLGIPTTPNNGIYLDTGEYPFLPLQNQHTYSTQEPEYASSTLQKRISSMLLSATQKLEYTPGTSQKLPDYFLLSTTQKLELTPSELSDSSLLSPTEKIEPIRAKFPKQPRSFLLSPTEKVEPRQTKLPKRARSFLLSPTEKIEPTQKLEPTPIRSQEQPDSSLLSPTEKMEPIRIKSRKQPGSSVKSIFLPILAGKTLLPLLPSGLFLLVPLTLLFTKVGFCMFGGGMVVLPLLQQELVNGQHLLTTKQLLDGFALGQLTPGPAIVVATFVGYKLAGITGAVIATIAVFAPSFVLTFGLTPVLRHVRHFPLIKGFLKGVSIGVVGAIAGSAITLGQVAIVDIWTALIAMISFILLLRWNINPAFLIAGAAFIGIIRFMIAGA